MKVSKLDLYSLVLKGLWICISGDWAAQSLKDGSTGGAVGYTVLGIGWAILTHREVNAILERANKVDEVKTSKG